MAENPVLTEARKRGIISTGTTSAGVKSSAATQSGSANPVVQEYNGTKAQERAASQQRIVETARQRTATQTQASEPQPKTDGLLSAILSTAERVKNTVSGAVKSTASAYTNAAGMAAEGAGKWNTRIANYTNKDTLQSAQEAVERYQAMLDSGKWADGRTMTAADRKQVQSMLEANQRKLTAQESYTNAVEASDKAVANQAYQTADRLAESSAQNLATAKEGLGKVGQFAVDLGSQGVQMAGDIAASAIIPGSGLALMGVRSGASSAQEARQSGATYGQQLAYGLGSGAVSIATEKLSSVAAPFKKAFGGGVLDEALSKTVSKMNGSAVGKAVLSMLSEGGEEAVEDLVQPILQRMTYDRDALGQYGDADYWAQMLYDGLVGAAMGGIGSGVEAVQNRIASKKTTGNAAGAQTAAREGNDVTPAQNAPQAAQTPSQAGIMEQETARLFGQNNAAPETGTAGSKYDMFQAAAIRKDSKTFRNLVAGFDTSVSEFFNKWREGRSNTTTEKLEKLYLGKMSENAKSKVSAILGYDIDTRDMIVTNDDVKHIIDSHGSAEAELQRGNLPLEQWAIDALPDVVTQPDSITPGEIQSSGKHPGKQGVLFSKTMPNGTVVTVQFDNKGRKTMELTTMYVKKSGPHTQAFNVENDSSQLTAKPVPDPVSSAPGEQTDRANPTSLAANGDAGTRDSSPDVDYNITQGAENVKSQGQGDVLSDILFGGKRADMNTLTEAQQNAVYQANDTGTVGMDADGRVFRIDPEQHIDRRDGADIASRKVNAFQFDHPQLHTYYKSAAETLMQELVGAQPGGQTQSATGEYGQTYSWRTRRSASSRIETLLDGGMSYDRIEKALDAIIHDRGQENYADAKRVEMVLDNMLTNGYNDGGTQFVPANEAYLSAKNQIAGSSSAERGYRLDGLGAANAGSLNSDFQNLQAQSDTFHPEGANAARPVDVPTTNFEGRNIPKAAATIMGAQALNENDVRLIEQQIANGTLAFDTIKDVDAVSRAQQTVQRKGFDGALEQYRQEVNASVATKDNQTLGQQLLLQASRDGNEAAVGEILTLYTRNSTTVAQAMQAQSILRKLSPEGQLLSVQRALNDLNTKYNTDVQLTESEISDFLNAKDGDARQKVQERIIERAAQSVPGTFRAKYDTLRYLAMLGNPRTHIRNILGNTLFQVPVMAKNRVGAVLELGVNRASGGKVERTKSVLGANPLGKLAAEARADWANAKDFLTQNSKYGEGQASLSTIEQQADAFSNENVVGRTINRLSNTNSALLEAEDTAAKKFIYSQSLASYLKANGVKSIQDADMGLLYRARNYAAQEALRNTFNDHNMVSDAVAKLGNLSHSDNKVEKAAGYVVEGMLPFKRTPTNIVVRAAEYNPVSSVVNAVAAVHNAKAGDVNAVARNLDRVAAGVSGAALMAAGLLAAGAGYVTGGEDEDEKQQDFDDLTGNQTYALQLKDGTSVTLDWLAPEAIPFFMGVELYNAGIDDGLTWGEVANTLKNMSAPMLEMSMLQGLNDTVNDAAYAANRGDSVIASLITSALTNYMTQVIPTLGGQVERVGETERMTTYTDKNSSIPTDFQYTIGKVSQKIPGWDYQQIPYIDAWGRTEDTGSEAERIFNNFFNPAYVSQVDVDKVEQELQRVKDATGDSNVFPQRAGRSITVNGETKNLTAEEYQKYAKALGQGSYALVKDGLSLPAYQSMSDTAKAEYIDRLYKYAAQTAKAEVSDYETETWVKNAKTAERDIGVSTAEYIALYEKYGSDIMSGQSYEKTKQAVAAGLTVAQWADMKGGLDADGNGSVSQSEAEAYLNGQRFSNSTKADLWTIINKSWKKNPYA